MDEDGELPQLPPSINWGLPEVAPDTIEAFELEEKRQFLDRLAQGYGPDVAGGAIGWSPHRIKQILRDPDMQQLMKLVDSRLDQNVVRAMYLAAVTGNVTAGQFWLLNRRPEEWRDTKKIVVERNERVSIEVIHSVKQGALELLQEAGIRALQPGGVIDVDESDRD